MAVPGAPKPPTNSMGGKSQSILDGIITGLFGPDTSAMTPEDAAATEKARKQDQAEAYALADSARKNPGAQFMGGPTNLGGGGDLLKMLVKMFSGGGGG